MASYTYIVLSLKENGIPHLHSKKKTNLVCVDYGTYKISTVSYTKTVIRLLSEMKSTLIHNVQELYFIHSYTRKSSFKLNLNCNGIML